MFVSVYCFSQSLLLAGTRPTPSHSNNRVVVVPCCDEVRNVAPVRRDAKWMAVCVCGLRGPVRILDVPSASAR